MSEEFFVGADGVTIRKETTTSTFYLVLSEIEKVNESEYQVTVLVQSIGEKTLIGTYYPDMPRGNLLFGDQRITITGRGRRKLDDAIEEYRRQYQ